jgi:hypothetical protein
MDNSLDSIIKNLLRVVDFEDFDGFLENFNEKKYLLADTNMSSRLYSYYKKMGLAEVNANEKNKVSTKWKVAKLSALEVVWINILYELKGIGLNNEEAETIKKNLFSKLVLKTEKNKTLLKTLIKSLETEKIMSDDELELEELQKISPTILEYMIYFFVKTNRIGGMIFTDDMFSFFLDVPIYTIKERFEIMENYFLISHRFFSFSSLMGQIKDDFTTYKVDVPIIESDDLWEKSLDKLFGGKNKTGKYDNHFEVKEKKSINPKDKKIEIIASEEKDQDILLKVRDGKKVTIEQVILKKKI